MSAGKVTLCLCRTLLAASLHDHGVGARLPLRSRRASAIFECAFGGVFTFAVQCNRSGLGLCLGRTKLVAWHAVVAHVFAAVPLAQPMQLDR